MARAVEKESKKPYAPPTLTVYGTVHELTKKVGLARSLDGGRFPRVRTAI
ncbi:MAG TPA: lasso RiPP family leader peptide-containing protein [Verrucomicrobiae bacterium]|nr:lasso RiPP family leader peptide-containing protein [Verrucomicrobiae bacterium]